MSEFKLTTEILALSSTSKWETAKLEWDLHEVFESEEPETCLCGHYPIIENCVLRNKFNAHLATVGNCCVKKFIGLPSDLIFQAVKRIRACITKSLNGEAVSYAYERGWINEWEFSFYADIMRKRVLSPKQTATKEKINRKFLLKMRSSRSTASTPKN